MATSLSYNQIFPDVIWGATFKEVINVSDTGNIFICHVSVTDLEKIALPLSQKVTDQNWIVDLDHRSRRAYEATALRTAQSLVNVFKTSLTAENKVASEFGEMMVSIGSSRALEVVFGHRSLPIAELWKPNIGQNEGFDFHTVCTQDLVNFGEAKFSGSGSPYGGDSGDSTGSGGQADGFIAAEKHLADNQHLPALAGEGAASNLDQDQFGIVLAFSVNAQKPLLVFQNAMTQTQTYEHLKKARNIYIVGVSYDPTAN